MYVAEVFWLRDVLSAIRKLFLWVDWCWVGFGLIGFTGLCFLVCKVCLRGIVVCVWFE